MRMKALPEIAGPLLAWYEENARALPWRERPTPYRVWVSEIMLQQTRIEAARGYFERFTEAFPDVKALAEAPEDRVLKLWEGLGYYSRARNLHKAAKLLLEQHGGELPADPAALRALPGVGDYTAGAIASIAFGLPEPAVDGNVLRICARLCCCEESIGGEKIKKHFREELRGQYREACGALSSAIMELGETVCLPGTPDCSRCPLADRCAAHEAGRETDYPVMPAKKARKIQPVTVLLLEHDGRFALRRRKDRGLLAGLWEFPNLPGRLSREQALAWAEEMGLQPRDAADCGGAVHIFSHVEWHMCGWRIPCGAESPELVWVPDLRDHALPAAFRAYKAQMTTKNPKE